jgi:hypothetical protein
MKLCSCMKNDNIDAIDHMHEIDYTISHGWIFL